MTPDFSKLREPFQPSDIEWRIAERGANGNGQWAKVLAYITNRAIQDRLDEVCGPENWRNEFKQIPGAFLCGLAIRVNGEWIEKWDGAQESQIEATKGGISGAMKRAAVQWGIGRYLYDLEGQWAKIHPGGKNYAGKDQKKNLDAMKWDPPDLPTWAIPRTLKPEAPEGQTPQIDEEKAKEKLRAEFQQLKGFIQVAASIDELDAIMVSEEYARQPEAGKKALNAEYEKRKGAL